MLSRVVGIGSSAGGLSAYKAFFEALAPDTGMAFVVLSHIVPAADGPLVEIVASYTQLPVRIPVQGLQPEPNCIYMAPSKADVILERAIFGVSTPRALMDPQIVLFLSSLAEDQGENAIGIIFSGYGNDGTNGCKNIKARGGKTFAQDDASAEIDEMPRNAALAGCIDHVLSPQKIAAELSKISFVISRPDN